MISKGCATNETTTGGHRKAKEAWVFRVVFVTYEPQWRRRVATQEWILSIIPRNLKARSYVDYLLPGGTEGRAAVIIYRVIMIAASLGEVLSMYI